MDLLSSIPVCTGIGTLSDVAQQPENRKATTRPKGKPTPKRGEQKLRTGLSPTVQWLLFIMLIAVVCVAIWMLLDGGSFGEDIPRQRLEGTS